MRTCTALPAILLTVLLHAGVAVAEEWTDVETFGGAVRAEYSRSSLTVVSPTARRVRTRFVSSTGNPIPELNVYSVESETEYYCPLPLEKLLTARIVSIKGDASPLETIDPQVYNDIPHGSNSYRLWLAVCHEPAAPK